MKDEIIENNKLIAAFMGLKVHQFERKGQSFLVTDDERRDGFDFDLVQYHSSFDWLMPVVRKCCLEIEKDGLNYDGKTTIEELNAKRIRTFYLNNTIEAVWGAVIDFIKFHNTHK